MVRRFSTVIRRLTVVHILHLRYIEILQHGSLKAGLEIAAGDGDPQNNGCDGLADRLHGVQVRPVVKGVPLGIEIVVASGQPSVERTFCVRFFCVDLSVIVMVLPCEDLDAATEYPEAVDHRVLATGDVGVKAFQNLFVESNTFRCSFGPGISRPHYGGSW